MENEKRKTLDQIREALKGPLGKERKSALNCLEALTPVLAQTNKDRKVIESELRGLKALLSQSMESLSIEGYTYPGIGGVSLIRNESSSISQERLIGALKTEGLSAPAIQRILKGCQLRTQREYIQLYPE